MKIFIYKILIIAVAILLVFEITIGSKIKEINRKIDNVIGAGGRYKVKEKLKTEMRKAINKENYFTQEERELISEFIKKIKNEISSVEK